MQKQVNDAWKTARLVYRPIEDTDADIEFYEKCIANDPEVRASLSHAPFLPTPRSTAASQLRSYKSDLLCAYVCKKSYSPTSVKVPHTVIGMAGLTTSGAPKRTANMYVAIVREQQGRGYESETINRILEWAFRFGGVVSFDGK